MADIKKIAADIEKRRSSPDGSKKESKKNNSGSISNSEFIGNRLGTFDDGIQKIIKNEMKKYDTIYGFGFLGKLDSLQPESARLAREMSDPLSRISSDVEKRTAMLLEITGLKNAFPSFLNNYQSNLMEGRSVSSAGVRLSHDPLILATINQLESMTNKFIKSFGNLATPLQLNHSPGSLVGVADSTRRFESLTSRSILHDIGRMEHMIASIAKELNFAGNTSPFFDLLYSGSAREFIGGSHIVSYDTSSKFKADFLTSVKKGIVDTSSFYDTSRAEKTLSYLKYMDRIERVSTKELMEAIEREGAETRRELVEAIEREGSETRKEVIEAVERIETKGNIDRCINIFSLAIGLFLLADYLGYIPSSSESPLGSSADPKIETPNLQNPTDNNGRDDLEVPELKRLIII